MKVRTKPCRQLGRSLLAIVAMLPTLASAHGSDHLHFWGRHLTEVLPIPAVLALLAMGFLGWWLARDRD